VAELDPITVTLALGAARATTSLSELGRLLLCAEESGDGVGRRVRVLEEEEVTSLQELQLGVRQAGSEDPFR
jgi:hypothetical protein